MKKINLLISCLVGCLLFTGCNAIQHNNQPIQSKSYKNSNSNLYVEIDIEKNGVKLDHLSTVSSGKNTINLTSSVQDKGGNHIITSQFFAKDITKIAHNVYSMNYSVLIKIPFTTGKNQISYSEVGNNSSINIVLGQQACIYANKDYKVKILATSK